MACLHASTVTDELHCIPQRSSMPYADSPVKQPSLLCRPASRARGGLRKSVTIGSRACSFERQIVRSNHEAVASFASEVALSFHLAIVPSIWPIQRHPHPLTWPERGGSHESHHADAFGAR